jgi:GNAT superfamily N-acetyltransferase
MSRQAFKPSVAIRRVWNDSIWSHRDAIVRIECASYEVGRRDDYALFEKIAKTDRSISLLAFIGLELVGFSFAAPLEIFEHVGGVRDDTELGRKSTLYAADTTVAPTFRQRGIARALKQRQIMLAAQMGYSLIAGRIRIGLAADMWRLVYSLGGREEARIYNAYGDGIQPDECIYYHLKVWGCADDSRFLVEGAASSSSFPKEIQNQRSR